VTRKRALKIVLTFMLIGFALAWLFSRGREAAQPEVATVAPSSEDALLYGDEIVVDFKDDEPHDRIAALGEKLGVQFVPNSSHFDVDEIYTARTSNPAAVLAALRADPDVEAADYQIEYSIPETELAATEMGDEELEPKDPGFPNDPKFHLQWHLDQIRMKGAWKKAQGEGVIVAVIDTGVAKVPDLAATELVGGYNFVGNTDDATDDHGHGTHVAGTIAQSTNNGVGVAGVAFKAKIMPIKVLSARGSGSVSGIAEGIRFAADHGAKVINMSLGGPLASSVLSKAIDYAHQKGVVVVCAAGNDGRGKVSYPAAYPHSIAVASTQFDETTTFYSNWGKEIDIAAPGGNTRVDQNGDGFPDGVLQNTVVPGDTKRNDYLWFMGTSMASPHVAGVAALVVGAGVTDPDAVEKILKETAREPKSGRTDNQNRYGAGIIDADAAVTKAQTTHGVAELGIALALAGAILWRLRRAGRLAHGLGAGGVATMILGSSGLFFLPLLGLGTGWFFTHGLPSWDLAFGAAAHGNPVVFSALAPIAAAIFLYGRKSLRGAIAGLAIGVAAHLFFRAAIRTMDVQWVPNALDAAWLGVNAFLSAAVAWAVLRK
jgi:serine protease